MSYSLQIELPSVFRLPTGGVSCYQVFIVLSHTPIIQTRIGDL